MHLTIDSGNVFQNTSGMYKPDPDDIKKMYPETAKLLVGNTEMDDYSSSIHVNSTVSGLPRGPQVDANWGLKSFQPKRASKSMCVG